MFKYALLLLLSILLFLYGSFPVSRNEAQVSKSPPHRIGNISVNPSKLYRPRFEKLVLIIIDALRWDFATPELMPLTFRHLKRNGCLSKVLVESPTVTLPRIKALTTGNVPQYADLIKNLASSEILSNSWLHSARAQNMSIVFYGDNSWEKLFPNTFLRSEGTTSFFVWDYTEVDNNVTRNVHKEFEKTDWDIMILHYLGLDHIGHTLGPFSSRMIAKLIEMDDIISSIYDKIGSTKNTLILVTGDHGMRNEGGHGGTTHAEVTVPLIAIGQNCNNSTFLQTDIPANIAILLGIDIPSSSIGQVRRQFLNHLTEEEYLYNLRYNLEILLEKMNMCRSNFYKATELHLKFLGGNIKHVNETIQLYEECSQGIAEMLHERSRKMNDDLLANVVLLLVDIFILLVLELFGCRGSVKMQLFCSILLFFFANSSLIIVIKVILVFSILIHLKKLFYNITPKIFSNDSCIELFLIITCVLHPVTFFSSSFIEEEHYYWFFFSITLLLFLVYESITQTKTNRDIIRQLFILAYIRFCMDLNSTSENSIQNDNNWANLLKLPENKFYFHSFFFLGLISLFITFLIINHQNIISNFFSFLILMFMWKLKCLAYHDILLGQLIWATILSLKIVGKSDWLTFWIQASALLSKPHNMLLLPLVVLIGKELINDKKIEKRPLLLAIESYVFSNCFYFLQGHRNSLATVDVSVGYTALSDYYPFLVITQVIIHTYMFPIILHVIVLKNASKCYSRDFWHATLLLRVLVIFFTCVVMIAFKHHLFIWSVFAPKLVIESVHTGFLFVELCIWTLIHLICR